MKKLLIVILMTTAAIATMAQQMRFVAGGYYLPLYSKAGERVKVKPFYMDVYPVTNKEFLAFVKANPQWSRSKVKRLFADEHYLCNWKSDFEIGANVKEDAPVTYVSWFAAKVYAEWKGKRLPTVAEWEYAASASVTKPDAAADPKNIQRIQDWYSKISDSVIPAVGSTEKNYWGIYDMFGLIWEWNYDFNTAMVSGESRADSDVDKNLFCGGGSITANDLTNYPAFMRYGFRSSLKADYTVHNLGFRCVKDAEITVSVKN